MTIWKLGMNQLKATIQFLMLEIMVRVQIKQKVSFQDLEDCNMVNVIKFIIYNLYLSNYANKTMMLDITSKSINIATHSEWYEYWQGNKRTVERLVA